MLDRRRQPGGLDELEENVLSDVFRIAGVGDATADETAQAPRFAFDDRGDGAVVAGQRGSSGDLGGGHGV